MPPHVTVLVPVKDRRHQMLRCLDALLQQDYDDYDIVVLDNGSSDGTVEACRERARGRAVPVAVDVVDGRVGHVRNVGAGLARGELIAYTDSDCIASPQWLSAGTEPFEDRRVGVVTGCTRPEEEPPYGPWHATIEVLEQTWRFESCNVFFRREPFLIAGGFDESLGHLWEDTVAGWAMLREGWEAAFAPDALVYHDVTYPGRDWHLKRVHRYGKAAAVVRRFPEARERLLWRRYFLHKRDAQLLLALGGLAFARLNPTTSLLAVPYLRDRGPRGLKLADLRGARDRIAFDASMLLGAVRGSLRWRSLVL